MNRKEWRPGEKHQQFSAWEAGLEETLGLSQMASLWVPHNMDRPGRFKASPQGGELFAFWHNLKLCTNGLILSLVTWVEKHKWHPPPPKKKKNQTRCCHPEYSLDTESRAHCLAVPSPSQWRPKANTCLSVSLLLCLPLLLHTHQAARVTRCTRWRPPHDSALLSLRCRSHTANSAGTKKVGSKSPTHWRIWR